MGFTKLDEGILQSSIMAADPVTFKVWIAILAAAGSDGIARVAPTFLASVCRLPVERVRRALDELEGPDPDSRTPTKNGSRIERCEGGWLVLNHAKYRGWTYSQTPEAVRQRRHREGLGKRDVDVTERHGSVTVCDPSASVSASVSVEGGAGGDPALYRPTRAAQQALAAERIEKRLALCRKHPRQPGESAEEHRRRIDALLSPAQPDPDERQAMRLLGGGS